MVGLRSRCAGELGSAPFSARKDVSLRQLEDEFELSFVEPESGRPCTFRLRPIRPRLHIRDIRVLGSGTMDCVTYPHLALRGDAAGEGVEGNAWLDHQWGNLGWFFSLTAERRVRVLGWDWFAVNLDDGSDLLLMLHRDMSDGTVVRSYATGLGPGTETVLCHGIEATPSRFWKSPATDIRYPVAWDILVPELGLALRFEPLVDDQEIEVLGVIRAIWEGAATATGSLDGRPVAGRARMELHGYGYVLDYRDYLGRWADRIDRRIEEFLPKLLDTAQIEGLIRGVVGRAVESAARGRGAKRFWFEHDAWLLGNILVDLADPREKMPWFPLPSPRLLAWAIRSPRISRLARHVFRPVREVLPGLCILYAHARQRRLLRHPPSVLNGRAAQYLTRRIRRDQDFVIRGTYLDGRLSASLTRKG